MDLRCGHGLRGIGGDGRLCQTNILTCGVGRNGSDGHQRSASAVGESLGSWESGEKSDERTGRRKQRPGRREEKSGKARGEHELEFFVMAPAQVGRRPRFSSPRMSSNRSASWAARPSPSPSPSWSSRKEMLSTSAHRPPKRSYFLGLFHFSFAPHTLCPLRLNLHHICPMDSKDRHDCRQGASRAMKTLSHIALLVQCHA